MHTDSRSPRLQSRSGNVAWSQAASGMGQRKTRLSVKRRPSSKHHRCSSTDPGGMVRNRWLILQVPKQLCSRCNSAWGSSKSPKSDCSSKVFTTWVATKDWKKSAVPQTGEPSNSTPPCLSPSRRTSTGNSGKDWSPDGQKTSHLSIFRWRPNLGPFSKNCVNKSEMAERDPTNEPSSRYHSCNDDSYGRSVLSISSRRTKENRSGPRGSPC